MLLVKQRRSNSTLIEAALLIILQTTRSRTQFSYLYIIMDYRGT
jgi:hypothetical protein